MLARGHTGVTAIVFIVAYLALFLFITALGGLIIFIGWNLIAPALGLSAISYSVAFGAALLIGVVSSIFRR